MQYDKVRDLHADCKAQKYTFAHEGTIPSEHSAKGFYLPASIISNPPDESRIMQEEPFGPIFPCQPFSEEDDVVARANNTKFGLGASVFSKDLERARRVASRLEAGNVWINAGLAQHPGAYFSGWKESGLGGSGGVEGLKQFCNAKSVYEHF